MTDTTSQEKLRSATIDGVRSAIRSGAFSGQTAGLAKGKLQANLVILPAAAATEFEAYCRRNPRPCPLVGMTEPGKPFWSSLGDIDIRSDVPSYNVYRDGVLERKVTDITDLWQDDWVAFALGCSFTFEAALVRAGVKVAHIDANRTVPMYRSNQATMPVGPFGGGMVVSMRLVPDHQIELAQEVTARFPWAHGAPVHVGDPRKIGIADLENPDWGDAPVGVGTPVFWACGVTPQNALTRAGLPLVVTHTPGHMLITDIDDTENAFIQ